MNQNISVCNLNLRRSGILLHPTSIPGNQECGDLGPEAYHFVEFLASSGVAVWQTLPLGPTHSDGSPYQCLSVHAGNPLLINLDLLVQRGWLAEVSVGKITTDTFYSYLRQSRRHFEKNADQEDQDKYKSFLADQDDWIQNYSLFMALRQEFNGEHWINWPNEIRDRIPSALEKIRSRIKDSIEQVKFEQFLFFTQWLDLKYFANQRNVLLFGDLPIFVAHDSADVWASREQFAVDEHGHMLVVAGVPPDYFSATGQLWGNPHYNWEYMQANGFLWWQRRIQTQLELFDLIRIDHFRGFEAYWEIPADANTAMNGKWKKAPGDELFENLRKRFKNLPVIAEDLGLITPEVTKLREKHGIPGMKILQFAFDGNPKNPYLPHNHEKNCVVYTGTHDNNTSLGWFEDLPNKDQTTVLEYFGYPREPMPWALIRHAMASRANLAIIPMQDILSLDENHRMNTPGTTKGNWSWRFTWDQLEKDVFLKLQRLNALYSRCSVDFT